jgi:hypothetical protein
MKQVGKPRERPEPSGNFRLVRPLDSHGVAVFSVSTARETTFYALHEIRCDIGGRGFAVHRLGIGTLYHVRVGKPADCSCECLGFLRHGRCRHILGLLALIRDGSI